MGLIAGGAQTGFGEANKMPESHEEYLKREQQKQENKNEKN